MAKDWSSTEVQAAVADYFAMLALELAGKPFNKAARNRALQERLHQRGRTSVEFKHANISHVLKEAGYPIIDGYKPRSNIQGILTVEVHRFLSEHPGVLDDLRQEADRDVSPIPAFDDDSLPTLEAPPPILQLPDRVRERSERRVLPPIDYFEREARNRSLGAAGEDLVLQIERARLRRAGLDDLVPEIEHVSRTRGDGAGFDIRSFETDGSQRFIEVKTTVSSQYSPFYFSRNELDFSRECADRYHLYRLHSFRSKPRLFTLKGEIQRHCILDPTQYRATLGTRVEGLAGT